MQENNSEKKNKNVKILYKCTTCALYILTVGCTWNAFLIFGFVVDFQ